MAKINPKWVKYRDMGGPRYLGQKENGKFVHVYNPSKPWGVWSQILGVVARCEGRFDTVVMYDETGVTAGTFQWTFKSGRLQKLLQFFKSIPYMDFEKDEEQTLFDVVCEDAHGTQIFAKYGFTIQGGKFFVGRKLNASKASDRKIIIDTCMGRRKMHATQKEQRQFALRLCKEFAVLGQKMEVQAAMVEYAKLEFKKALDVKRKILNSVGGTIRCLLPDAVWGTPIPAIFFNLWQNSPGGAYKMYKNAWKEAVNKDIANPVQGGGFHVSELGAQDMLDIVWRRLCRSSYADWGFKSKQYLESGGKNPPRIKNIRPAIKEFYGVDLKYIK